MRARARERKRERERERESVYVSVARTSPRSNTILSLPPGTPIACTRTRQPCALCCWCATSGTRCVTLFPCSPGHVICAIDSTVVYDSAGMNANLAGSSAVLACSRSDMTTTPLVVCYMQLGLHMSCELSIDIRS